MNLADQVRKIQPRISRAAWDNHEHYRGYAVMVLPFSSGNLLGLRVFPENDFAPYKSVWHRNPAGEWSIYNDGPSLQTTCPRWWGPALEHTELTPFDLTWTGPNALRVEMEQPSLLWTIKMTETTLLRALNTVMAALPLWLWKLTPQHWIAEWTAKWLLDMGDLSFSFPTPSEQDAVLIPDQYYFIESSEAIWQGEDLGTPVQLEANPTIGRVPLPTRAAFVIGQAQARILDPQEYRQARAEMWAGDK